MVADFELYRMKEQNIKFTPHLSIKGEKHIKCMFGTSNPRLLGVAKRSKPPDHMLSIDNIYHYMYNSYKTRR